jgi:hypothetical protein
MKVKEKINQKKDKGELHSRANLHEFDPPGKTPLRSPAACRSHSPEGHPAARPAPPLPRGTHDVSDVVFTAAVTSPQNSSCPTAIPSFARYHRMCLAHI